MTLPSPGQLAAMACMLEATARKPGNVHRYADFDDATLLDFLLSALAIPQPLDRAHRIGVGAAVLEAVEATRAVVTTNTNLGIILLLAPLSAAAATSRDGDLRSELVRVLRTTTQDDARLIYRAIRLARPGGLGSVPEQDVAAEPTGTLLEVMQLAEHRDAIARQYVHDFGDIFRPLPCLRERLSGGLPLETAIILIHLELMAAQPDTLIARKCGPALAEEASRRAQSVLDASWPCAGQHEMASLDAWLRADGHARNPGATADLVTAALFVAFQDGTIPLPRPAGPSGWTGPLG